MANMRKWREICLEKYVTPIPASRSHLESLKNELLEDSTMLEVEDWGVTEGGLAFVHGDCLKDNILYKPGSSKGLIDFEYSGYASPAFDIASVFTELTYDITRPTHPFFVYLPENKVSDAEIAEWVKAYGDGPEFYVQVKITAMISHIYWAFWGLAMA
jgi:thiamine kinase-like enzyme